VLGLLLLFSYPWQTLSAGVIAYLIFLPLSVRAYAKRAQIEEAKVVEAQAAASGEPNADAQPDGEPKPEN
jgi:CDP-diacylglycerol--serine O-phosphatidyltransferase